MASSTIAWKVIVALFTPIIVWLGGILLALIPWIQRQILYLHNAPMSWGERLSIPETFGFLRNQVAPFYITTPDDQKLYAWLIAPLAVVAANEKEFSLGNETFDPSIESSAVFKHLRDDPESRLLIYFHGNTGTIGQARRTDEYRTLSSGASDKIFILAFDYRGFGHSTGSPNERGLITDAVSVVTWALEVAHVSSEHIVLLSQSLGTAVATAATEHFIVAEPKIEFAGLILCAAFTDAANVFLDFSILGNVPVMAPLKMAKFTTNFFRRRYKDSWKTSDRLATVARRSDRLRVTLCHATSDAIIPWEHCQGLFYAAVNGMNDRKLTRAEVDDRKTTHDLGEGGWVCSWSSGDKSIKQRIVKYGGHDAIMKWGPVALLVLESFELGQIDVEEL